jgi:hypothetical protein
MPGYADISHFLTKGEMFYALSDVDEANDTKYYGYLSANSSWIIRKVVESTGTVRYVGGHDDYTTNFTGRAGLSYDYYDQIWS